MVRALAVGGVRTGAFAHESATPVASGVGEILLSYRAGDQHGEISEPADGQNPQFRQDFPFYDRSRSSAPHLNQSFLRAFSLSPVTSISPGRHANEVTEPGREMLLVVKPGLYRNLGEW